MASLEELLNTGLGGIIQGGGLPQEEALYQRQALSDRENLSARGLGISTVTRDALAKARVDASLAAQQAQLAALGQAAGVTQGNANRAQQESQFSRNLSQQKDLANNQMLAGGIGAGVGALGSLAGASFGPEIRTGARGMFGLKPHPGDVERPGQNNTPAGQMPTATESTITPFADPGAGSGGGPSLSDFQLPTTSFGSSDFLPTDFGDFGAMPDLSRLFDYQYGYM